MLSSLSKLNKGKPTLTDSISIHFNAASMNSLDDDDDDDAEENSRPILTIQTSKAYNEEGNTHTMPASEMPSSDVKQTDTGHTPREHSPSQASKEASPAPERPSLLSGIREKLRERDFPEPFQDLIGRLDDRFSTESEETVKDRKQKRVDSVDEPIIRTPGMRKSESLDSASLTLSKNSGLTFSSIKTFDQHSSAQVPVNHIESSRNPSVESEASVDPVSTPASEVGAYSRSNSFEMIDDLYTFDEPFEDFDGFRPVIPKPTVKKLHKLSSRRPRGQDLLDDSDYNAEDEEEFFDPCEDTPTDEPVISLNTPQNSAAHASMKQTSWWELYQHRLPSQQRFSVAVAVFLILLLVMPPFIAGMMLGGTLVMLCMTAYMVLYLRPAPTIISNNEKAHQNFNTNLPYIESHVKADTAKFKGWMNYLPSYSVEDYHLSSTQSIYVQLEGSSLRIQKPKLPNSKLAMFDESNMASSVFVSHQHYNIAGSHVSLQPHNLCDKRLWSKKYPIVVSLAERCTLDRRLSAQSPTTATPRTFDSTVAESNVNLVSDDTKESIGSTPILADNRSGIINSFHIADKSVAGSSAESSRQSSEEQDSSKDLAGENKTLSRQMREKVSSKPSSREGSANRESGRESIPDVSLVGQERADVNVSGEWSIVSEREGSVESGKSVKEDQRCLYLFARTCRQKEEWYRRLQAASKGQPLPTSLVELLRPRIQPSHSTSSVNTPTSVAQTLPSTDNATRHRRHASLDSAVPVIAPDLAPPPTPTSTLTPCEQTLRQYLHYMAVVMPDGLSRRPSGGRSSRERGSKKPSTPGQYDLSWFNVLISRIMFDFLREDNWRQVIKEKIKNKLAKIHVPYFIDDLTVCDIDLGSEVPQLLRVSRPPYLNEQGLWVHVDVAYHGGLQMSLETKINLMKLKKAAATDDDDDHETEPSLISSNSAITDPDEEDSAESSEDDEYKEDVKDYKLDTTDTDSGTVAGSSKSKKFMRLVNRITASRYFQQATEYKYIKRAMEGVSNTPLVLTVELNRLVGTLAINVPPPPSDRLWYGFTANPDLIISAKPKVGEREVSVTIVTDWIQKKLATEFQRVLVMPNMDDLQIPVMCAKLYSFLDCVRPNDEGAEASSQQQDAAVSAEHHAVSTCEQLNNANILPS